MAAIAKLELTNVFADNTTAKTTIDNIRPENINETTIKTTIVNFNAAKGGDLASKMKSANGFNWVGIKKAQVTITDKTVIF